MATPEPVEHSKRLVRAAAAELVRLRGERRQVAALAERLRESLDEAEARGAALDERINVLVALAGDGEVLPGRAAGDNVIAFPDASSEPARGYLRGFEIREAAVRVLRRAQAAPAPIHYTDWFALFQEAGYGIAGLDPLSTFLTQIGRSPVVVRSEEPGTYLLDEQAPQLLREQLDQLNEELLGLHGGQQTIEQIASSRERRSELVTRISRIERALEEALQVMNDAVLE